MKDDKISKLMLLKELYEKGIITAEQLDAEKAKIMSGEDSTPDPKDEAPINEGKNNVIDEGISVESSAQDDEKIGPSGINNMCLEQSQAVLEDEKAEYREGERESVAEINTIRPPKETKDISHRSHILLIIIAVIIGGVAAIYGIKQTNVPLCTLYDDGSWALNLYHKGICYQDNGESFLVIPKAEVISAIKLSIGRTGVIEKKTVSLPVSDLFVVREWGSINNNDIAAEKVDDLGIEIYSESRWPGQILLFMQDTKEYYLFPVRGLGYVPEGTYFIPYDRPIDNPYIGEYFYPFIKHYFESLVDSTPYAPVIYNESTKEFVRKGKLHMRITHMMMELPEDLNSKGTAKFIFEKCKPSIETSEMTRIANNAVQQYGFANYDAIKADYRRNSITANNKYLGRPYFFDLTLSGVSKREDENGKYYVESDDENVGDFYTDNDIYASFNYPIRVLILAAFTDIWMSWPYSRMEINGREAGYWGVITGETLEYLNVRSEEGITFYVNK